MGKTYDIPGLSPQQWPTETGDQSQIKAFYGNPCDPSEFVTVSIPWHCNAQHVEVHKKCADSFKRILDAAWTHANHDQAVMDASHLNVCDGTYSCRSNANDPSRKSMHSWAIAVDWAAAWNPNGSTWTGAASQLPRWFIDCWLAEGWAWGGDFGGTKDPMHFQATKNIHSDAPATVAVLQLGSSGADVIRLQAALGIAQSGTFDQATDAAVRAFQAAHNLDVDGIVGPLTWAELSVPSQPPVTTIPPLSPIPGTIEEVLDLLVERSGLKNELDAAKAEWISDLEALKAKISAFNLKVQLSIPAVPQVPPVKPPDQPVWVNKNIVATVFGGAGDEQKTAYSDVASGWPDRPGVALPAAFKSPRPLVALVRGGTTLVAPIVDKGPWYDGTAARPADPYWDTHTRPRAETDPHTNSAGIDLTPAAAKQLGIDGKGRLDWHFVTSPAPQAKGTIMGGPMTTSAGIGTILAAVGALATGLSKGALDPTALMTLVSALVSGVGLIFAKDHNVTGGTTPNK